MYNNRLSGSIPTTIEQLTNMLFLDLSVNQLSGAIPTQVSGMTKLIKLQLFNNTLIGPLPMTIGSMQFLQNLDLYNNRLHLSIPAWTNLKELTRLDLDNNLLTGSIPNEIGTSIPKLATLWLSNNQLTGSIPASIASRATLKFFYFHRNAGLTGEFNPTRSVTVTHLNTGVTLCGCAASKSPAKTFPPPGTCLTTPTSCLAPLVKRTAVPATMIGTSPPFLCNMDPQKNPMQNCMESLTKICTNSVSPHTNCKTAVDAAFSAATDVWKNVRLRCGRWQWPYDASIKPSCSASVNGCQACIDANTALLGASYRLSSDRLAQVDQTITNALNGLWDRIQ